MFLDRHKQDVDNIHGCQFNSYMYQYVRMKKKILLVWFPSSDSHVLVNLDGSEKECN